MMDVHNLTWVFAFIVTTTLLACPVVSFTNGFRYFRPLVSVNCNLIDVVIWASLRHIITFSSAIFTLTRMSSKYLFTVWTSYIIKNFSILMLTFSRAIFFVSIIFSSKEFFSAVATGSLRILTMVNSTTLLATINKMCAPFELFQTHWASMMILLLFMLPLALNGAIFSALFSMVILLVAINTGLKIIFFLASGAAIFRAIFLIFSFGNKGFVTGRTFIISMFFLRMVSTIKTAKFASFNRGLKNCLALLASMNIHFTSASESALLEGRSRLARMAGFSDRRPISFGNYNMAGVI